MDENWGKTWLLKMFQDCRQNYIIFTPDFLKVLTLWLRLRQIIQAAFVLIMTSLPNITPHYVHTTCPLRVGLAQKGLYESLDTNSQSYLSKSIS